MPRSTRWSLAAVATTLAALSLAVPAASATAATTTSAQTPAETGWLAVADGTFHVCGIASDHTIWCWGGGRSCELGDGQCQPEPSPVEVGSRTDWQALMAGHDDTCALGSDALLWCWGLGLHGQLGDGSTANAPSPVQIGTAQWTAVSGSPGGRHYTDDSHTCGIQTDTTLWCWGQNGQGQLGIGRTGQRTRPTQVGDETGWAQVSAGDEMTCAVRQDGTLWCWGHGYLGNGQVETSLVPEQVGSGAHWASVSTSGAATCAVRTGGALWCWGANYYGQVGDGSTVSEPTPEHIGSASWASVHAGLSTTCGTQSDGTAWCWGDGTTGELGSRVDQASTPTEITKGPAGWQPDVVVTYQDSCGLGVDTTLWCWGSNHFGQLVNGRTSGKSYHPHLITPPRQRVVN